MQLEVQKSSRTELAAQAAQRRRSVGVHPVEAGGEVGGVDGAGVTPRGHGEIPGVHGLISP